MIKSRLNSYTYTRHARVLFASALAWTLLIGSPATFAEGPGWTANSTVKKIVVTADGGINVLLSPQPTACVSNGGYGSAFASIYPTHPGINRMKADLLTAYITGSLVSLYFTDNKCRIGELVLGGW